MRGFFVRNAQHSAAQHSAAQRSTAQHSAAQRNTAQHSATQRSAAQRSATQRKKNLPAYLPRYFASLRGIDQAQARQIKRGAIALNVQCKRSIKRAAMQRWRCQFCGVANKLLI